MSKREHNDRKVPIDPDVREQKLKDSTYSSVGRELQDNFNRQAHAQAVKATYDSTHAKSDWGKKVAQQNSEDQAKAAKRR